MNLQKNSERNSFRWRRAVASASGATASASARRCQARSRTGGGLGGMVSFGSLSRAGAARLVLFSGPAAVATGLAAAMAPFHLTFDMLLRSQDGVLAPQLLRTRA